MIAWRFHKSLLWISLFVVILELFLGLFYFMFRLDIPFVHGGDLVLLGRIGHVLLWLAVSILIFGWDLRDRPEQ